MTRTRETTKPSDRPAARDRSPSHRHTMSYSRLALALGISFLLMWSLTYAGVNAFDEIFVNLNRFYMAVMMTSSMLVVMVAVMWKMFASPRVNVVIVVLALLVFVGAFGALRAETFVGDREFLRNMIPHHSIAIHTCNNADIEDRQVVELCGEIVESQREEIAEMRRILARLDQEP